MKYHKFTLRDAMADIHGGHDNVPKTFVVPDNVNIMMNASDDLRPGWRVSCVDARVRGGDGVSCLSYLGLGGVEAGVVDVCACCLTRATMGWPRSYFELSI